MKKSKRTMIVVTALSMIMSTAGNITLSYAQPSGEGNEYIPIDMSQMYNTNRIYTSNETYTGGLAGDTGAFRYNEFIGMVDGEGNSKWKNDWTSGMTDNILLHDGIDFQMRVVDCGNGDRNSQNCLFLNNSADAYTYIDVADDNYISIELLANTDKKLATGMSTRYIGIKLNYVDGTHDVIEKPINFFLSEGTNPVVSLSNKSGSMAQISHLSVNVNYFKKLDSFQILNEQYVFAKEADDSYKQDANGDYITVKHSGATRKARSHSAAVYAMTLVRNKEKTQEAIKEEAKALYLDVYNAIDALGEITYESKSALDAIGEKINKIIALGLPVTVTEVANLDTYNVALTRWEELRVEKIITDISDMITALGDIDSLTIAKEQDILDITNAIDSAIAEGISINSDTVANYSDYERALVKLDELRIEKKKQDIIDAITALGDVEELTSADLERIEAIQTMMDNAKKEGIEISSATITNFAAFKRAEEIVKANVPYGDVVDLSGYYNTADIYTTDLSHDGAAGYAGSFSYNWMINNIAWEEEWGSNVDNTFVMDGIRFKLRVVDYTKDTQACIFKNNDTGSPFSKIDVTDGNYTNVHILANSDMSWPSGGFKRLGVKVNYNDGTYDLIDFASSYSRTSGGNAAGVNAIKNIAMSGGGEGSITHYVIPTDHDKVLTDIEILNDLYDFVLVDEINEENYKKSNVINDPELFTYDDNDQPVTTQYTTSRWRSHHSAAIYAISLELPYGEYKTKVVNRIKENEKLLSSKMEVDNGKISKLYNEGKTIFLNIASDLKILDDKDFENSLTNYNLVKSSLPVLEKGSYSTKNDIITATIEFNKNMKALDGKIKIKCGDVQIPDFKLKQENNKATVKFVNLFDDVHSYKITVDSTAEASEGTGLTLGAVEVFTFNTSGNIVLTDVKLKDSEDRDINDLSKFTGSEVFFKANLSNYRAGEYFIALCAYNEKGRLIAVKNLTVDNTKNPNLSGKINATGAKEIKVLFMNNATTMKTIYTTYTK